MSLLLNPMKRLAEHTKFYPNIFCSDYTHVRLHRLVKAAQPNLADLCSSDLGRGALQKRAPTKIIDALHTRLSMTTTLNAAWIAEAT
jgi:hypothetical protein